jgi:hypothetical protein
MLENIGDKDESDHNFYLEMEGEEDKSPGLNHIQNILIHSRDIWLWRTSFQAYDVLAVDCYCLCVIRS